MPFKLTVMGRARDPMPTFAEMGSLVLHPIAPPMQVGGAWTMPSVDIRQTALPADRPHIEALARSLGLGTYKPYDPPPERSLALMPEDHFVLPVNPEGTREEIFKVEHEASVVLLIYFVASEPRLRFGINGEEIELDCRWAVGCIGMATATWDTRAGRMTLTYCAGTLEGFRAAATSNGDNK